MSKKVSIVVPVYNGEKFIVNCLQQLLDQDYENTEIIVVNDGSTDNSLDLINRNFENIKVFSKQNGGTGSALNLGFSKAKGEFFTWASCDDVKYKNYISTLVRALEESDCQFCFSKFDQFVDPNFDSRINKNYSRMPHSGIMHNFLNTTYRYCATGICFMFTKKMKQMCGPYDEIPGEDYIMGAKMGLLTDVYFVNETLGAHRLHPESLTVKTPSCTNEAGKKVKEILRNYA
jgi:glycosyltransferase involved in cell wall biosynthesis